MIDPLWGTFNHALPPHPNGDFMTSPLRLDGAAGAPLPGDIGVRGSLSSELKGLADLFVAGNLSPAEYEMCKAAVMARFHKLDAARAAASGIAATPEDERFSRTQAQLASQGVLTAARPHSASPSPEADDQGYEVSTEASPARAATAGFTLLVCAGVYGQKVNLEVEFEQCPAVADVHAKATQLFKAEVAAAKQPDHPFLDVRFIRLQVYNDTAGTWCDLITSDQLKDFAQVFGFMPASAWQPGGPAPSPRDIPAPRKPVLTGGCTSVRTNNVPFTAGTLLKVNYPGGSVPLRDAPTDESTCLMWLADGTSVRELTPALSSWRFVQIEERTGYIHERFVTPAVLPLAYKPPPPIATLPVSHCSYTISVSAHVYGSVATVQAVFDPSCSSLDTLSRLVEECLVDEAKRRCPTEHATVPDRVWKGSVVTKSIQIHDAGAAGWVDLYSTRQLSDTCNLFVQLTTSKERPSEGDTVMLAPGHAPELLATGCLKPGEMGVVVLPPEVDTTDQEGTLSITVRGPRGDSFVYFKDDLMLLNTENGHASAVGSRNDAISLELDQLRTAKAAAVAAEEFEQARNLKTRIDRLVEHQRRTNERLTHVREQIKFTAQLKDDAAAHENYAEAARLKADLQRLRAEEQQLSAEMGPPHHSDSKSHTSYRHMSVPELTDAFRKGMSHIRSSAGLVSIAEALHDASPAALYSIIAEFQPSLSTGKIQRNWRKIVEIYVAHAEKALVTQGSQVSGSERGELAVYSESYIPYGEVASQIKGVISFLDSPLSPRTLKEVRHLRKTGSSSF